MTTTRLSAFGLCALLCACNPEIRLGANENIPSIKGSQEFSLAGWMCTQPISAEGYTVTSRVVGSDCELSFDNTVTVVKESDYSNIPELRSASNLVQAVELEVKQLAFSDAATGTSLDLNTYVKSAVLKVDGQQVADKSALSSLPKTVKLTGEALTGIKSKIDARQPATVHATAVLLVPQTPRPPDRLKVDYDAQPTLVLGTGQIQLPQ
jgi:hypothetical protein